MSNNESKQERRERIARELGKRVMQAKLFTSRRQQALNTGLERMRGRGAAKSLRKANKKATGAFTRAAGAVKKVLGPTTKFAENALPPGHRTWSYAE